MIPTTEEFLAAVRAGDTAAVAAALRAQPSLAGARDAQGVSAYLWACYARQADVRAYWPARQTVRSSFAPFAPISRLLRDRSSAPLSPGRGRG